MNRRGPVYSIDDYAYKSPAGVWNPMFKLIVAVAVLLLGIAGKSAVASLYIIFTMAAFNRWKNRIAPGNYVKLLAIPLVFVILGSVAIALEVGYEGRAFRIYVTRVGLETSIRAALRAFAAISALYFLALSTPMGEIIQTLRKCRMPKVLAELMHLTYRYIFILTDTERTIRYAAKSRLGYVDFRTSLKTFGRSAGNLFILSLGRAGQKFDAMTARCYDGELLFLEEKKRVSFIQMLTFALYIASILMVEIISRRGELP